LKFVAAQDGKRLFSLSPNGLVKEWVLTHPLALDVLDVLHELKGHEQEVRNLVTLPESGLVVTCSGDKTIRAWKDATQYRVFSLGSFAASNVLCAVDHKTVAADVGSHLLFWDVSENNYSLTSLYSEENARQLGYLDRGLDPSVKILSINRLSLTQLALGTTCGLFLVTNEDGVWNANRTSSFVGAVDKAMILYSGSEAYELTAELEIARLYAGYLHGDCRGNVVRFNDSENVQRLLVPTSEGVEEVSSGRLVCDIAQHLGSLELTLCGSFLLIRAVSSGRLFLLRLAF
jgi:hypothetical protein